MDDDYSGHRVINKTVRTACIPASYPSSPQNPIMDWDWRFGLKDLACGSEFSFARPSAATSTFPGVNVKTVASNAPRFESNGMPLEGSATNLALWSNSFTAEHGHTLTDCTTVVSPSEYILTDGNDAPRYATILTATSNSGRVARNNISVTSGTKVNWSIFVRGISGKFRFAGYDGAQLVSAIFDPITKAFSSISDPGGISSQLQYQTLSNNWFRLSITITPSVTSSTAAASIGMELSGDSGYISGSQFVEGSVVTSYVYTEDTPVTRASEGSDTSNNGLTMPLTQAMVDSLEGEMIDWSTAGTFSNGGADSAYVTVTAAEKKIKVVPTDHSVYWGKTSTLEIGATYESSVTISGFNSGSFYIGYGSASGNQRTSNGTYVERFTATGTTSIFFRGITNSGFTVTINYCRRVLDSGQTNPGAGTVLCGVYLPWPISTLGGIAMPIVTTDNNGARTLFINNNLIKSYDGANAATISGATLPAGRYCLLSQWSAALGKMRVGIYNPATGILTWGNYATYRGFFPITSTGGQRLRFFYGGGNFNINLTSTQWFNCILTDDDMLFYIKKFGCSL